MATILFYAPFNQRSRDTESLMLAFYRQGHRVISLSQQEGFLINDFLNANGISAYSYVLAGKRGGWWYYLRHLLFFVRFCRKHHVEIVYSHLEPANFIAALAQFLIKATVFVCRHHSDQYRGLKRDNDLSYRLTYRLAKHIIVFSEITRHYMIREERIPRHKITRINLGYDFSLYPAVRIGHVESIKQLYSADIMLITVGSFIPLKRTEISIYVVKVLLDKGFDTKLFLLGKGELEHSLRALVEKLDLMDRVFFPGYVDNVLEYIAASSFLLHPSLSEASCVAVKEAGLVNKPVITCSGVGDFDDYIVHKKNGFSVAPDKFLEQASEIIQENFRNHDFLKGVGENLRKSVIELFSIENVIGHYNSLNNTR